MKTRLSSAVATKIHGYYRQMSITVSMGSMTAQSQGIGGWHCIATVILLLSAKPASASTRGP